MSSLRREMARGWPAQWDNTVCEFGLFVQKLGLHDECPLFPIAVIQVARIKRFSTAAFGQKRTQQALVRLSKTKPIRPNKAVKRDERYVSQLFMDTNDVVIRIVN